MNRLSETQKNVLMFVSATLFHAPINITSTDWKAIFLEAKLQSVVPVVFSSAKPYIPEEELGIWKRYVNKCLANNVRIEWEHTQLHKMMTEAGVPYVVLKGSASASYYPEPILRSMGDVDFLVNKCDLERAESVLEAHGFKPVSKTGNVNHIIYLRKEGNSVSKWELHWEPSLMPEGEEGKVIHEQFSDIVDRATLKQASGGQYMAPTAFHHGLTMLLHTAKHMITSGMGLRHLCDWAVYLDGLSDGEFTEMFEEVLRSAGLWRFTRLLSAVSAKYLQCRERSWAAVEDDALLEDMICDIFAGGNFGQKDPGRMNESRLMTDNDKGKVDDTGLFSQLCNTMNTTSRNHLPITRRFPILLPVGWVYVGVRHIFRIIIGKRPKINPAKMVRGATERKKIYLEFHLFEAEKTDKNQ